MIPARITYGRLVGQAFGSQRVCLVSMESLNFWSNNNEHKTAKRLSFNIDNMIFISAA